MAATDTARGGYGFRIEGLPEAEHWMIPVSERAPSLRVSVTLGEADLTPPRVDEHAGELRLLGGGRMFARRGDPAVHYRFEAAPPDADLLHPFLTPAAALHWRWDGVETLHAGAFVAGAGAVVVLGDKEAGKSTTLGWLANETGAPVLTDDLVVLRAGAVLAGPRSLDLRPGAPGADRAGAVRGSDRRRVTLAPVAPEVPAAGTIVLAWGDSVTLEEMDATTRLTNLAASRNYPLLPGDPAALLALAALPAIRLVRPRELSSLAEAARLALQRFS